MIVQGPQVWEGFSVQLKHSLVQNQIVESEVRRITLFINWFSYCSKRNYSSYLVSLVLLIQNHVFCVIFGYSRYKKCPYLKKNSIKHLHSQKVFPETKYTYLKSYQTNKMMDQKLTRSILICF